MKRAFTLIELLVVIAIIAILAAILFPVFAQAKLAAKKTQTLSSLKQIGLGFLMYSNDYDDMAPPFTNNAGDAANWSALRHMFPSLVDPYIKSGINPNNGEIKDLWADPLTKPLLANQSAIRNTFGYNVYGLGGFTRTCLGRVAGCGARTAAVWGEFASTEYDSPATFSSLQAPAQTLVISTGEQLVRAPQYGVANNGGAGNGVGLFGNSGQGGDRLLNSGLSAASPNRDARERLYVGGDAIIAYADGHAKVVKNSTLWSNRYRSVNGAWRGGVPDGPSMNRGWSRAWPEL